MKSRVQNADGEVWLELTKIVWSTCHVSSISLFAAAYRLSEADTYSLASLRSLASGPMSSLVSSPMFSATLLTSYVSFPASSSVPSLSSSLSSSLTTSPLLENHGF